MQRSPCRRKRDVGHRRRELPLLLDDRLAGARGGALPSHAHTPDARVRATHASRVHRSAAKVHAAAVAARRDARAGPLCGRQRSRHVARQQPARSSDSRSGKRGDCSLGFIFYFVFADFEDKIRVRSASRFTGSVVRDRRSTTLTLPPIGRSERLDCPIGCSWWACCTTAAS